jgi:hypothetical protein
MTGSFIAVLLGDTLEARSGAVDRSALIAAGARAVITWADLSTASQSASPDGGPVGSNPGGGGSEPDGDTPAVLIDPADAAVVLIADLAAALDALDALDAPDAVDSAPGWSGAVTATTRPVTDTLKLVDAAGTLTGTADRHLHRLVATPIAGKLRLLRAVAARFPAASPAGGSPSPSAVLAALVAQGVRVIGTATG